MRAALLHFVAERGSVDIPTATKELSQYDSTFLTQSIDELVTEGFLTVQEQVLSIR